MKVLLNVEVENIEKDINRQIIVDDNLRLSNFCEMLILSFNGEYPYFYEFHTDDNSYSPLDLKDSLSVDNIILKNLKIKIGQEFDLEYNIDKSYYFKIKVDKIYDDENDNSFFEVISGKGYGIVEDCGGTLGLYEVFYGENSYYEQYHINDFDLEKCNKMFK